MVCRLMTVLALGLLLVTSASAQESAPAKLEVGSGLQPVRPLIGPLPTPLQQAHTLSKSAKTIAHYTEITTLCEKAIDQTHDRSAQQYAKQLLAWAANRRGEAYSLEAVRLASASKFDEAAAQDAQALADFDTSAMYDPRKWKAFHNRGVSYALLGRYEEALADLTKAIELNGTDANTWFNRAEVRYELGQYEDATEDYSQVLEREPEDFGAITGRGHAWFRMGEFHKALADYSRSVVIDPKSAGALVNRGDAHRQLGKWAEAAADYRAAIKLDEKYGRAYRAAAWLLATCPDEKYRDAEQALQAAQQAIEAVTDEARESVEERLRLYQAQKPYRLPLQFAARPTPARR
jgi:tetratricopeptide (TPR) repeat protein